MQIDGRVLRKIIIRGLREWEPLKPLKPKQSTGWCHVRYSKQLLFHHESRRE